MPISTVCNHSSIGGQGRYEGKLLKVRARIVSGSYISLLMHRVQYDAAVAIFTLQKELFLTN